MPAPVALFVYQRLEHTRKTVEALLRNEYASETDLIVFSDAAASPAIESDVENVREYINQIHGFNSLSVRYRSYNYGLAKSIISGVSSILEQRGRVIVLEDDMVTSPYFLQYMNEALDKFAEDNRVISIHGYVYPLKNPLPEAFFLRGADCWGWATWSRGWKLFNSDGRHLLNELRRRKLTKAFDFDGTSPYTKMLEGQINGHNDSWAIRWYASAFLANKLTLYPGRSLVHNIGNDSSGTHCGSSDAMDVLLSATPVAIDNANVEESLVVKNYFKNYFRAIRNHTLLKIQLKQLMSKDLRKSLVRFAKDCLPPLLISQLRLLLNKKNGITFDGPFLTWDDAVKSSTGYDSNIILQKVISSALKVKSGIAVCERDSVLFDEIHYSWPITAGLMWASARSGGKLSVLDFGGSLGSSYYQNRKFFNGLESVHWSVVEQPQLVAAGRKFIEDDQLSFYESFTESVSAHKPNVILLSSVLQYLCDPYRILDQILRCPASIILIDRTPFHDEKNDIILVQNVGKHIYPASYPSWVFSKTRFLNHLNRFFSVEIDCLSPEGFVKYSNGSFSYNTLLMQRSQP